MPRKPAWPPPIYSHKRSGTDRVRIWRDGKHTDLQLGPTGSAEAKREYARICAELSNNQGRLAPPKVGDLTVADLVARWRVDADFNYRQPDGTVSREVESFKYPIAILLEVAGHLAAKEFGPSALKQVQKAMARRGWCRRVCNRHLTRVKTLFGWAESEELVPAATVHGLSKVHGLRPGQAPDYDEVPPIPEADLAATLPQLHAVARAMAETQLWTGARPGEVCRLTPGEIHREDRVEIRRGVTIETGGLVWVYRPKKHKTAYRGHARLVLIGPKVQAILHPYLDRGADVPLFSPREATERYLADQGRTLAFAASRTPGDRYTVSAYGHAIAAACRRAGVDRWAPNQLRHNAATRLADQFGWEVARIVLGHRSVDVTRIYVADNLSKAIDAIRQAG